MDLSEQLCLIRLANMQLRPRLLMALLTCAREEPCRLFQDDSELLDSVIGLQERHLAKLKDPSYEASREQMEWMERSDTALLHYYDDEYPEGLREMPDSPPLLFLRGPLKETDRFGIAIVGSRHATSYGKSVAEKLSKELAEKGISVVSGGALGIDTAAHRGAMLGGGRTIAILGCGPDVAYPRENRLLFETIAANGTILSEYPPSTQPETWRFPARNRLISAISQATLVIEASPSSGALITARFAAEQGRTVMAVPGNIDRPSSSGCNELIKEGAQLVTGIDDILHAIGAFVAAPIQTAMDLTELEPNAVLPAGLNENQTLLIKAMSLTPRHIDQIAQEASLSATTTGMEMTLLELRGMVRRLPGNNYIRILG